MNPARFRLTVDCNGRTIWIADEHRDNGKRLVVHADEKLTAFVDWIQRFAAGNVNVIC